MKKLFLITIICAFGCEGNPHRILTREPDESVEAQVKGLQETTQVQTKRIKILESQVNKLQVDMIDQQEQDIKSLHQMKDIIEAQTRLIKYLERKEKKRCR